MDNAKDFAAAILDTMVSFGKAPRSNFPMRSMAQKQRRGKERQAGRDQVKQRKAKVDKRQTLAARRRAARARREQQRPRGQRDEKARRQFPFGVRVVHHDARRLGQEGMTERRAVELSVAQDQPREKWHRSLSASTLRNWVRQVKRATGNYGALWPLSRRPPHTSLRGLDRVDGGHSAP